MWLSSSVLIAVSHDSSSLIQMSVKETSRLTWAFISSNTISFYMGQDASETYLKTAAQSKVNKPNHTITLIPAGADLGFIKGEGGEWG